MDETPEEEGNLNLAIFENSPAFPILTKSVATRGILFALTGLLIDRGLLDRDEVLAAVIAERDSYIKHVEGDLVDGEPAPTDALAERFKTETVEGFDKFVSRLQER